MGKGKQHKFNERTDYSYERELKGLPLRSAKSEPFIVLSFRNFDRSQGQSFQEWEKNQLLALAIEKLTGICQFTVPQAIANKMIKQYSKGTFPKNSDFHHPKHVPDDIAWCSMHIQGKECVIGYFTDNIFNIVFLDKEHRFWISEKKHT